MIHEAWEYFSPWMRVYTNPLHKRRAWLLRSALGGPAFTDASLTHTTACLPFGFASFDCAQDRQGKRARLSVHKVLDRTCECPDNIQFCSITGSCIADGRFSAFDPARMRQDFDAGS